MQILLQISIRTIFLKHSSKYFLQILTISQRLFTACRVKSKPLGWTFKTLHNIEQNENKILRPRHFPLCNYGPANWKHSLFLEDAFLILCLCASSIFLLARSLCISAWWLFHSLKALFRSNYSWPPQLHGSAITNPSPCHFSMVFCAPSIRMSWIPPWIYLRVWSTTSLLVHGLKSRPETLLPLTIVKRGTVPHVMVCP